MTSRHGRRPPCSGLEERVAQLATSRGHLLAYRALVHDLSSAGDGEAVLDIGLQDYPPGRTALLALRLRTRQADLIPSPRAACGPGPRGSGATRLFHSVRGAMHLHRVSDMPLFAAALRHADGTDLAKQSIGSFGVDLAEAGVGFDMAMGDVAAAMGQVMSDAQPRTKGELSAAVTPMVSARLAPWCDGCGMHHVHDALFRYATLRAGLTIEVESPSRFRFRPPTGTMPDLEPEASRAEVVRRFLHAFGPAKPVHLAAWLDLTPACARRWWDLVASELLPITVDGTTLHVHISDLDQFGSTPALPTARLLPPYDPLTELADRHVLVRNTAERRQVWTPAANPGVVLIDGEIAGIWRQRAAANRLTLTITLFRPLSAPRRRALETDARTIAEYFGAHHHALSFAA